MSTFEVRSYFINVGVGDCAIHLIIENKTKIFASTLFDGGLHTAADLIKENIQRLGEKFNTTIKFDSIVVTHWDEDHYVGTMQMLLSDLHQNIKNTRKQESSYIDPKKTVFYYPMAGLNKTMKASNYDLTDGFLKLKWMEEGQMVTSDRLCAARGSIKCLGYDLFHTRGLNAQPLQYGAVPSLDSVCKTKQCFASTPSPCPIFLVVGIDTFFINDKNAKEVSPAAVFDDLNETSLMAAVIWPSEDNSTKPRVSLFTGGDASEAEEVRFLQWAGEDSIIEAIKAGHHGSHFSTHEDLFKHGLRSLIISAGESHGHPSFSLTYFAMVFMLHMYDAGNAPTFLAMRPPYWLTKYGGSKETARTVEFNIRKVLSYEANALHVALEALTEAGIVQKTLKSAIIHVRNWAANDPITKLFDSIERDKVLAEFPNRKLVLDDKMFPKPLEFKDKKNGLTVHEQAEAEFLAAEQEVLKFMKGVLNRFCIPKPANTSKRQQKQTRFIEVIASSSDMKEKVVKYPDATQVVAKQAGFWNRNRSRTDYGDISKKLFGDGKTGTPVKPLKKYAMGINLEEDSDDDDEDDEANKKTKKKELRKARAQRGKRNQTKGDNIMFFTLDAPNNILMAAEQPALPDTTADAAREKELIRAFFVDVDASDSPPPATRSGSEPGTLAEAWFRDCIGASSIIIDKSHDSGGLEAASKITIMGPQSSQQTNNSSKVTTYSFTTDKSVRETQFNTGGLVGGEQTTLGYDPRTDGLILGLETLENFTFSDFLTMIQYSAQPWIKNLLDAVPLAAPKPGSRSGLWLQPDADMYTVLRVQTSVSDLGAAEKFADLVKKITGLDIHSIDVVGFATFDPAHMIDETVVMVESKVSLHVAVKSAATGESSILGNGLAVVLTSEGVEFTVQLGDLNNPVESTLKWLNNRLSQLNSDQLSSAAPVPVGVNAADPISSVARQLDSAIRTLSSNFKPRRIQMAIGSDHKLTHFSIDIQSGMERGALPGKHVPILFSIYWTPGQLNIGGQIWSQSEPAIPFSINPFKEDFLDLKFDMTDTVDGISIPLLINSDQPIIFPTGIPSIIKRGSISLTVTDGSPIIKLEGSAVCDIPDLSTDIPTICLDSLDLKLQYQASKDLFIQFRGSVSVDLSPDHDGEYSTIGMRVLVAYEKSDLGSQWRIIASAKDIQFAGLFSFFREDGSNYSLTDFMSNLAVPNVEVEYVYTSKQPSQLSISGSIKLGPILLGMSYKQKKGEEWTFEADVRPDAKLQQTEVTMKSLLSGLVNDLESIPEFVADLTLSLSKVKGGIKCYSVTQKALKYSVFSLQLDVGDFSFTFAQIQRYDTFTKTAQMKPPTRILRFGISGFPETDVKVVGNFKLPFDELDVLWVSADLTQPELEILNQKAFAGHSPLLYQNNIKADPKEGGSSGRPKVLLQSGCHFQVLLHESSAPSLVLDYAFHKSKQGSQTPSGLKPADPSASPASSPPSDSVQGDTAVAPLTKTVGPVSVRSIGVKATSANKIVITIDASVTLGPVGLALLGFAVGLDFAAVKSPSQLMRVKPDFGLDGMAVAFDRPPIRLAGVFSKTSKTEGTEYRGGITISVGAWSAMAVGAYEELQTYKSLFVFGILSGPLVEFGCAEINGVAGGFGYNSHLGLPDVDHVATFPLVAMNRGLKEPKGDIMLQLVELTSGPGMQCITPQKDSLWLAAGISIKAFQMLDVLAVIALDLSSDPKFGLIAEATAIIPKGADREKAFVVLELDLIAVVDPGHGLLTVSGQLTPRSFILSPTCKVSGGFCMAYFFEGSGHEGDWVLSIGGYHPSFQPPAHYPPTPPRLGISWVYDNELSITGEAYFAITPNACMGGGRLDAIFCTGRTKATFSAYANFLMYFRPFHFQSEIGVNVYASSVIGWGFLSKEISLEISAMLELHGPPIAGVAHLHFWFLDVSVRFGPDSSGVPKLTTSQFLAMIKQASTEEEAAKVEDHLFSIQRGAIANGQEVASQQAKKDPTLEEHLLRATQLQLNIQSRFPILTASCNNKPVPINNSNSIFISPMQIANPVTTSTFKVTITELDTNKSPAFSSIVLTKNVPSAIWKKYEGELNPGSLGKSTSKAFAMGLVVEPEKSTPSNEGLAAFSVIKFSSESILHPVPDIKALEKSQMIGSAGQQSSQDDAQARQRVTQILGDPKVEIAQQKVLDCWSRFRAKYTGGGRQFASSDPTPSIKAFMPKSADAMLKERFTHALPVVFG